MLRISKWGVFDSSSSLYYSPNIKRLAADEDYFRLQVGSYRVIFKKENRRLLILIVRIGHRKEIYLSLV